MKEICWVPSSYISSTNLVLDRRKNKKKGMKSNHFSESESLSAGLGRLCAAREFLSVCISGTEWIKKGNRRRLLIYIHIENEELPNLFSPKYDDDRDSAHEPIFHHHLVVFYFFSFPSYCGLSPPRFPISRSKRNITNSVA